MLFIIPNETGVSHAHVSDRDRNAQQQEQTDRRQDLRESSLVCCFGNHAGIAGNESRNRTGRNDLLLVLAKIRTSDATAEKVIEGEIERGSPLKQIDRFLKLITGKSAHEKNSFPLSRSGHCCDRDFGLVISVSIRRSWRHL
jgi:hypothetical protein